MATETETVDTDEATEALEGADEDFSELDDFDWLLNDEATDSSVDPDAESDEDEQAEDEGTLSEELTTLRVNGADKQVNRDELIDLAQKGDDYTRKTQELSEQREALKPFAKLAEDLEADANGTIRWLAEQFGVDLSVDPEVEDPRDRELRRLRTDVTELSQKAALDAAKREIQSDLNRLEATHGQFDREALVKFAAENTLPNLDQAYLAWEGQKALADRQSAAEKAARAKANKNREVVETEPGRRERASGPATTGKLTVRQAFEAAAKEAGHTRRR